MKKLTGILFLLLMAVGAKAEVPYGVPCSIDASTGTNSVLCTDDRAVVYSIIISSVASTDYMILQDTDTAATQAATHSVVFATGEGSDEGADVTRIFKFDPPLYFNNGIAAKVSVAPTGAGISKWTIMYRTGTR